MTYISGNLSTEPVQIYENSNPYAGTFDAPTESVGISGSDGYNSPGPVGGIDILQCLLFFF